MSKIRLHRDDAIAVVARFIISIGVQLQRSQWLSGMNATLALYRQRYRTRKQLSSLTDSQLRDIGLTREQALIESSRPFWR